MVGQKIQMSSGTTFTVEEFDKDLNRWKIKSDGVGVTMFVTHDYIDRNATFLEEVPNGL